MMRAHKQCKTCPFRGIEESERRELARIPAAEWACHTEQGYDSTCDTQCRGHWEAQRKYPAEAAEGPLGSYPEELTEDQIAYINERAEDLRARAALTEHHRTEVER